MADAAEIRAEMPGDGGNVLTGSWSPDGAPEAGAAMQAWFGNTVDIYAELANFLQLRLQENLQTQLEYQRCGTPGELRDVSCRYLKVAFEQYCEETGRILQMNRNAQKAILGKGAAG